MSGEQHAEQSNFQCVLYAGMQNGRLRIFAQLHGPILMKIGDVAHEDVTDSFVHLLRTVGPTLEGE